MDRLMGFVGLIVFIAIAYAISNNRKKINWKLVAWGLGLQFIFAVLILPDSFFNQFIKNSFNLEMAPGGWVFAQLNTVINKLLSFTHAGTDFLIASTPLGYVSPALRNFLFGVLPTILFFSSFMAILYHLGIIQKLVAVIARVMAKTMGTSGSESLSASANIFVGQTEAPLVIKPYIEKMTQSELLAIMTGGMATVAGGIMAAYIAYLSHAIPDIAGHLIAASVMSAPAALVIAKIMIPETEKSETMGEINFDVPKTTSNVIDAAANGATDGVKLAVNVAAMVLVFIAMIALIDAVFGLLGSYIGMPYLSMTWLLGKVMAPVAFIMGIPWNDVNEIGSLLGIKTIVNELVAFSELSKMLNEPGTQISQKSLVIATYALCGFSNFSSIAIQIGGIGAIAPGRKKDLAKLGIRAVIAGSFACFMTASIAGVLSPADKPPGGLMTETAKAEVSPLKDSFHDLKKKLLSNADIDIRRQHLKQALNKQVNWQGEFISLAKTADATVVKLYFGIKEPDQIIGTEPNDFARFIIKTPPGSITFTSGKKKITRNWKDLKKGDLVKFEGLLTKFQPTEDASILFEIEQAVVKNTAGK